MEIKIKEQELRKFCENICLKVGLSQKDTYIFVDSLLFANLRGIDSHGIMRFPPYVRRLVEGGAKINPQIKKVREESSMILIDGDSGMGQIVSMYATKLAIDKAKKVGISIVGVKNSSHFGAASYYTIKMAEKNMVGISMTNGLTVMAAWGGVKRVIGNNPLSIAAPYKKDKPVVLDMAMSKVSGGKVRLAAKNNQKIPQDWIIDPQGKKTDDPNNLAKGGALLPFGEYKGYGLAVMIEILVGILTGAGRLHEVKSWLKTSNAPIYTGHCFIAINIENFISLESFKERLDWVVKELKSSPLAKGFKGIFVPGEIEFEIERRRRKEGIPISEEIWKDLKGLSKTYHEPLKKFGRLNNF
ncbi:putative oxidoreductase YjmC [subsurface metagenome]